MPVPRFRLPLLLTAVVILLTLPTQAQPRTLEPEPGAASGLRTALVIGNADYPGTGADLVNPLNDARDVAAALQRLGFTVVTGTNLSRRQMLDALRTFEDRARGADAALVFYAGHGVELDGENYLLPTSLSRDIRRYEVEHEAVGLRRVLGALEATEVPLKLVILDACRDDPFRSWRSANGGGWRSLGAAPSGTLIFYGTSSASKASDNADAQDPNSLQDLTVYYRYKYETGTHSSLLSFDLGFTGTYDTVNNLVSCISFRQSTWREMEYYLEDQNGNRSRTYRSRVYKPSGSA